MCPTLSPVRPASRSTSPRQLPVRANEMAVVAVGDALEIVLVFRLRLPEVACRRNFGNDALRPEAGRVDIGYRFFGRATLVVTRVGDRGTVAREIGRAHV